MSDPGPQCPGCGYPIFGLRDLRCPECGRVLDVRDFNLEMEGRQDHLRRLRRDGQIGLSIGIFVLLIPTLLIFAIAGAIIYYFNSVPPCVITLLVIVFGVWFWRVLAYVGREALPPKKRR